MRLRNGTGRWDGRRGACAGALLFAVALSGPAAAATPTAAGTVIRNVATLSTAGDTVESNEVALTVLRMIDVAVAPVVARQPIAGVAADVAFVVRNTGNAEQRILLTAATATPGVTVAPADDAVMLAAGEERRIVVRVDGLADAIRDATVTLTATVAEGHGAPGSIVADAIVGASGAQASGTTLLTRDAPASAGPVLTKSQTVLAPDGSARVMPGAIVTYRLEARFDAPTPAVAIDDPIPAGTTFVAGSIAIDGVAQPDARHFDGAAVHVALGDIAAASTRTVRFQVNIQ